MDTAVWRLQYYFTRSMSFKYTSNDLWVEYTIIGATLYNILLYTYTLLYFKVTVFYAQGACKNKIKFICQQLLSAVNYKTKLRSVKNRPGIHTLVV